jgi:methyl-accepting chemotaxis protein/carbonic anhydrase
MQRLTAIFTLVMLALTSTAWAAGNGPGVTPAQALKKLQDGNARFVSGKLRHPNLNASRMKQTFTGGQHPFATVMTCSDSRVPVEAVYDAGIGDVFVIRVAGNVSDTDEIGSIEYGVNHLGTPVMVVLGHRSCGAVTAVVTNAEVHGSIPPLVDNIIPAVAKAQSQNPNLHGTDLVPAAVTANVWQSIEDLIARSSATRDRIKSGKLIVVGAVYDLANGKVEWLGQHPTQSQVLAAATSSGGHGAAASSHGASAGHSAGSAVDVELADAATMTKLQKDWLVTAEEVHLAELNVPFSQTFWVMMFLMIAMVGVGAFMFLSGAFSRFSFGMKLFTSYGSLACLAVFLGISTFVYVQGIADTAALEVEFLDMDIMSGEISNAQANFLLYGIQDKEFGDEQVATAKELIAEFTTDGDIIAQNEALDDENRQRLTAILADVKEYEKDFDEVVTAFHEIEVGKEEMDESAAEMEEVLEEMTRHHEQLLADAEAAGDMDEIIYQTTAVEDLAACEIHALKAFHAEVEFILDKNAHHVDVMSAELGQFLSYLHRLEGELKSADEVNQLEGVEESVNEYIATLKNVLRDEAIIEEEVSLMSALMNDIINKAATASHSAEALAHSMETEAEIAAIILTLIAMIVGVMFSVFVRGSISKPINTIIDGMTLAAQQVNQASGQVSSSSQSLAEGASEQASGLEETSSSLEEMASMTTQNAENAKQANTLAQDANTAAQQGNEAMAQMSSAIGEIKHSSDETAKIIKVIDEIAFQTNLLALNAAVEAARAGEAGKGFAVVAEEVRNLAQRSAEAAKNTNDLIEGSQQNAENGVRVSDEVATVLENITGSIGKVTELVSEISAASDEQAQGVDQVNTAVSQMDEITQKNAANAEESASASEELASQATQLDGMVSQLTALMNGGDSNGHHQPALQPTAQPTQQFTNSNGNGHTMTRSHNGNGHAKQLTRKANEAIIPLGDEDFSDF